MSTRHDGLVKHSSGPPLVLRAGAAGLTATLRTKHCRSRTQAASPRMASRCWWARRITSASAPPRLFAYVQALARTGTGGAGDDQRRGNSGVRLDRPFIGLSAAGQRSAGCGPQDPFPALHAQRPAATLARQTPLQLQHAELADKVCASLTRPN